MAAVTAERPGYKQGLAASAADRSFIAGSGWKLTS